MLTPQEKQILYEQMKLVLEQFMNPRSLQVLHAVLRIAGETMDAMLELDDALVDVGDDATCGPDPQMLDAHPDTDIPRSHGCPHS